MSRIIEIGSEYGKQQKVPGRKIMTTMDETLKTLLHLSQENIDETPAEKSDILPYALLLVKHNVPDIYYCLGIY